jgi:hypothetical protein
MISHNGVGNMNNLNMSMMNPTYMNGLNSSVSLNHFPLSNSINNYNINGFNHYPPMNTMMPMIPQMNNIIPNMPSMNNMMPMISPMNNMMQPMIPPMMPPINNMIQPMNDMMPFNNRNNVMNVNNINYISNNLLNSERNPILIPNNNINQNNNNNKNELKIQLFKELDEFQYKNKDKFNDAITEDECPICLCKYKITDKIKELPCRHIFHKKCLKQWFQRSDSCPICKFDIKDEINKRKAELEKHLYEEKNDEV